MIAKLSCDEKWIASEDRQFPIVVDPNITDSFVDCTLNGLGEYLTEAREKKDLSSVYINTIGSSFKGAIKVLVMGSGDYRGIINRSNNVHHYDIYSGKKYQLFNKVGENRHPLASLLIKGSPYQEVKFKWSPDYVPEKGVIRP